jgi:hypothetical protein
VLCLERMKEFTREQTKGDAFQQLQSENLDTQNDTWNVRIMWCDWCIKCWDGFKTAFSISALNLISTLWYNWTKLKETEVVEPLLRMPVGLRNAVLNWEVPWWHVKLNRSGTSLKDTLGMRMTSHTTLD